MTTIIWIYIFLWLISFTYSILNEKYFHNATNNFYSELLYAVAAFLCSFFLLGLFDFIHNTYMVAKREIKTFLVVMFAKYVVWKIKRKYKIK